MIDPLAVAVQGAVLQGDDLDLLALATDGFIVSLQVQPQPQPTPLIVKREPRPKQEPAPHNTASGGNAVVLTDVISPTWTPNFTVFYEEEKEEEEEADFALIHVPEPELEPTAVIKALADGTVETFIDDKGRRSIVLTGDDGTRYWYADVGEALIENGTQVQAGAPIGRTKQGAPSIPQSLAPRTVPAALPTTSEAQEAQVRRSRSRPVQLVFVESPPKSAARPPPAPPVRRIIRLVRLVPVQPRLFLGETIQTPERRASPPIAPIVISAAALAVAAYALLRPRTKPKRPRRKRQRRE